MRGAKVRRVRRAKTGLPLKVKKEKKEIRVRKV
jgi:hypothetical protein